MYWSKKLDPYILCYEVMFLGLFPESSYFCRKKSYFLWFACVGVLISRYLRLLASGVGDSRGLHLYVALDFYKTLSYVTSC